MKIIKFYPPLLLYFITLGTGFGQLSISNLMEGQLGKLPTETSKIFPSIYDRTEINYRVKGFILETTIEQYHTTSNDRNYVDLSQFSIRYKKNKWDLVIGNFYETLGRGLLLRSFEIPGALLEDIGFRSRNYFHRDILGASVKYRLKKATFQILRADVLNNVFPPTFSRSERRTDIVTAAVANVKYIKGHQAGIVLMLREQEGSTNNHYISGSVNGVIIKGLDYYSEYASDLKVNNYSFYTGIAGYKGAFSFTLEYKNYSNFILGAGINEPPALIKQQTYRVLNRSIHVSNPINEKGYQLDLFYNFKNGTTINFNHSLANNKFSGINATFTQYFFEITSSIGKNIEYKGFLDYSQDPFKGENKRYSIGLYTDIAINDKTRILPEVEYQSFNRGGNQLYNFNLLLALKITSKFSFSVLGEITNDPFIIDENNSLRIFLGNTIRYKPDFKNTFQLFFGERRGGPQCSAGVCYEILDFKGAEIRWVTRFRK